MSTGVNMKPVLIKGKNVELLNDESDFDTLKVTRILVKYEGEDDDLYLVKLANFRAGINFDLPYYEWVRYSLDAQYFEIVPDRIANKFLNNETYKVLPDGLNVPCGAIKK